MTDFTITGRLARFGRGGMIEDISNRLMRDFATCLAAAGIAATPAPSRRGGDDRRGGARGRRRRRRPASRDAPAGSGPAAATTGPGQADQRLLAVLRGALGSDRALFGRGRRSG